MRGLGELVCLVHCIDPRIQEAVEWLRRASGIRYGSFDRVSIAGGGGFFDRFERELDIAVKSHRVTRIVLTGHEDCLAGATPELVLGCADAVESRYAERVRAEAVWLRLDGSRETLERKPKRSA